MHELRILNGYHRGATLPLTEPGDLSIGADEDADVVLADPGILPRHATFTLAAGGWTLAAADGVIRDAHSNATPPQLALSFGDFARADRIWLTVVDDSTPWSDPPAEPQDQPEADAAGEDEAATPEEAAVAPDAIAAADLFDPNEEQALEAAQQAQAPANHAATGDGGERRGRGYRMVLVAFVAAIALSGAAAYGLTSHPDVSAKEALARQAELKRLAALPRQLPADELELALRKRLDQVDLLNRVTLDLGPREWIIRGALGEEDAERLQRMLRAFAKSYVIDFPISVKIGNAESMLPFRISQVMTGVDPSIVTDDGRRLYVGDEYRGVRLVAVAGNQLKFSGKHALNVSW
ncbi:FHA domain-containing protein [Herbaspirillum chlorophenolicum]|uniref:FHA domain-containing protein n=1 Tax=Herbaspirillum chlorophenolicum TaxID=211589 RepID=UPI00067A96BC|nr:FHA domain-containing protein [Herbaspirillum chlorophenolicum]